MAAEAPRKSTRVLPLRHIVTGAVGAAAMAALLLGAWAVGLISFGHSEESAAAPVTSAAPPTREEAPPPAPDPAPAQEQSVAAQPAPTQAAAPDPAVVALDQLDQLADSVLVAVRTYQTRRTQFGQGQADCAALAEALKAVEGHWINYNVQGKPRGLVLDVTRAARDRSLYAELDSVETHFDSSACPRP